jgi:hypothetical protein
MRDEDGYTLAECLVALFVVGLTVGGLTAGVRTIGRLEAARSRTGASDHAARPIQTALDSLLDGQGPFLSPAPARLVGDASGFSFDCGVGLRCGAWLAGGSRLALHVARGHDEQVAPLPGLASAQFVYAGARGSSPVWPAGVPQNQTLHSIGLIGRSADGDVALASARVWIEEPVSCDFDLILRACRR